MRRDLTERSTETELMDCEQVTFEDFRACLEDLATVNTLTLTRAPIVSWLDRATRGMAPGERVSVLDVGFGYGDLLRAVHLWSRRRALEAELVGVDLNAWSTAAAREATPPGLAIEYRTGDVFALHPERRFDFVISSQFAHHLSDENLVRFIAWMQSTTDRGWYIGDLHRHAVPFYAFGVLARLAGWHRFVQHDGPISIARSFRREDWVRLLTAAGVDPSAVEIRWHVPFRLCVGRVRS